MDNHSALNKQVLYSKIKSKTITLGGNLNLKIYGNLNCKSGKRMKITNRVFFVNAEEANNQGFRPCGNCLRTEYLEWKINNG